MVGLVDLEYQGARGVIAAGWFEAPRGLVLVDPGPASTLSAVRAALAARGRSVADVRAILVTHIHLDHSGGVGVLLRENPAIQVFVHERGAPHIIDPTRLLDSAARLYGDRLHALWGEILPVPSAAVTALSGGEVLDVAGVETLAAYTPGHASHHVSFLETSSGTAFVGDVAGIRLGAPLLVLPPTPPPDIDLDAWEGSLALIRAWKPERLFITHFGEFADADAHLDDLQRRLREAADVACRLVGDEGLTEEQRQGAFADWMRGLFRTVLPGEDWVRRHERAIPIAHDWQGLARYCRKKQLRG